MNIKHKKKEERKEEKQKIYCAPGSIPCAQIQKKTNLHKRKKTRLLNIR